MKNNGLEKHHMPSSCLVNWLGLPKSIQEIKMVTPQKHDRFHLRTQENLDVLKQTMTPGVEYKISIIPGRPIRERLATVRAELRALTKK